jgi:hypothetical protein
MVRILERLCDAEGWPCRKYTGTMSVESKDKNVDEFSNDPDIKILIAGLKCGGLGLNLTAASQVLLVGTYIRYDTSMTLDANQKHTPGGTRPSSSKPFAAYSGSY